MAVLVETLERNAFLIPPPVDNSFAEAIATNLQLNLANMSPDFISDLNNFNQQLARSSDLHLVSVFDEQARAFRIFMHMRRYGGGASVRFCQYFGFERRIVTGWSNYTKKGDVTRAVLVHISEMLLTHSINAECIDSLSPQQISVLIQIDHLLLGHPHGIRISLYRSIGLNPEVVLNADIIQLR